MKQNNITLEITELDSIISNATPGSLLPKKINMKQLQIQDINLKYRTKKKEISPENTLLT